MNIVWLGYWDPGGIAAMYCHCINRYTEHSARLIKFEETRMFDRDIVYRTAKWENGQIIGFDNIPDNQFKEMVIPILEDADVLIFNAAMSPRVGDPDYVVADTDHLNFGGIRLEEYSKFIPSIVFYFGATGLRKNYDWYNDVYNAKGWPAITCQPDIYRNLKIKTDINYVPILVVSDHVRYNSVMKVNENPIICHSPTDRRIKNTDDFIEIIEDLSQNYKFRVGMIENMTFPQSLQVKYNSNIALDHMQNDGYYCLTSVENSAMGLVNFVNLDDYGISLVEQDIGAPLEWEIVKNKYELHSKLEMYLKDWDLIERKQLRTKEWFKKYWHEKNHINKLTDIIEMYLNKNYGIRMGR